MRGGPLNRYHDNCNCVPVPVVVRWVVDDSVRGTHWERQTVQKIIDGVLIEVAAYGDNYSIFRSAFPVAGKEVYVNTQSVKIENTPRIGIKQSRGERNV